MRLSLGIDTGGTYTDAVLFDDEHGVVAKAKALTTRHDLAIGIAGAVDAVIAQARASVADIALVSLSTTLATNALVEGRGGRVALVFVGFGDSDAERGGLATAMRGEPVIQIAGGHNPQGDPVADIDLVALEREALAVAASVAGFAVTSRFATRNAEHEIAARDVLVRVTGLPVTCGHELSAKLDGPKRAVTSVLNARLIGLITGLIAAAERIVANHGIVAPIMVVRGDGSLMSASLAKSRPIETILSGPAASLVGAAYLTGTADAIVADVGGTTTDVAIIRDGVPQLDQNGAVVGGHQTMVEAVAMTTVGLGGDSEVTVRVDSNLPTLRLGPRRVIPIALLAADHPELVHRALDRQLLQAVSHEHDGRFVVPTAESGASAAGLDSGEKALLARVGAAPAPFAELLRGHADVRRLNRLVSRGLVMIAAFTPTDASHVLGDYVALDRSAAEKAAALLARQRNLLGKPVADGPTPMSEWIVSAIERRSAEVVLDAALGADGFERTDLSRHPLLAASLDGRAGVVDVAARLTIPLVALGASASVYYPAVAKMLRADGVIPADADVANAIGAVVGRVRTHVDVYVSAPERGRFRVHHPDCAADVFDLDQALALAEFYAGDGARIRALESGADSVEIVTMRAVSMATIEGEDFFVDATVTAIASGRPRLAR